MSTPWSADLWPDGWLTSISVERGGRDQAGRPTLGQVFTVDRVLVGWRSTSDSPEWDDAPEDLAVMYLERDTFEFQQWDLIIIPPGPWPSGRWQIDGSPQPSQLGTQVMLRRRI